MVFELFNVYVPKTVENFRVLCTGEKGEHLYHFKKSFIHRVIPNIMMQGGDITKGDGTGGVSIYGEKFADEAMWLPHTHKGILSMINKGPNSNTSQFAITFRDAAHLNKRNIVFGRVISGWDICAQIEKVRKGETPETNFKPVDPV